MGTNRWRAPQPATPGTGAPHSSEIPYVMDTVGTRYGDALTPEDATVAALTHGYWVAFAKTGRPDGAGLPARSTFTHTRQGSTDRAPDHKLIP